MEALCAYTQLLMKRSRKRSYEAVLHRKREAGRRRKQFARRQTQQRLAFLLIMSVAALHIHSPIRSVWSKGEEQFLVGADSGSHIYPAGLAGKL